MFVQLLLALIINLFYIIKIELNNDTVVLCRAALQLKLMNFATLTLLCKVLRNKYDLP